MTEQNTIVAHFDSPKALEALYQVPVLYAPVFWMNPHKLSWGIEYEMPQNGRSSERAYGIELYSTIERDNTYVYIGMSETADIIEELVPFIQETFTWFEREHDGHNWVGVWTYPEVLPDGFVVDKDLDVQDNIIENALNIITKHARKELYLLEASQVVSDMLEYGVYDIGSVVSSYSDEGTYAIVDEDAVVRVLLEIVERIVDEESSISEKEMACHVLNMVRDPDSPVPTWFKTFSEKLNQAGIHLVVDKQRHLRGVDSEPPEGLVFATQVDAGHLASAEAYRWMGLKRNDI